jgi:hypothetical protein
VKVFITEVNPWKTNQVRLQWDLEEVDESGVFVFEVYRSGSSNGPWTKIQDYTDVYIGYDDLDSESANILALSRDLYYYIRLIPPSGVPNQSDSPIVNIEGQAEVTVLESQPGIGYRVTDYAQFEAGPQTNLTKRPINENAMDKRLRLIRRKMLRDQYLLLSKFNGIEYLMLKRRHFGVRCPDCYDPTTRKVTISHCDTCHGTSWQEGFFTPIEMLGRRLASQIQTDLSSQTKDDIDMTRIQLQNFPRIDEGDLLIEKARNRRFLVKQRYFTTLKTMPVHQTVSVSELERQAKEYAISVTL